MSSDCIWSAQLRFTVVLCTSVLGNVVQAGGYDPNAPFNPTWDQDVSTSESLEIRGAPLGLLSGDNVLVSEVEVLEGATQIASDPNGFGFSVDLSGDYLFDFDQHILKPEAQTALEGLIKLYAAYDGREILIVGHTDAKGSDQYNQALSERRAESVRAWFADRQVEEGLLTAIGRGEDEPVASNTVGGQDNPEGRALNRRVEITVITEKKVNHLPIIGN
ncbi:OmpA family protein [Epibacterium ulvae]|uniref:OmpA family protein n=1 Tax=Epibacterium ulvae TaxID=1156985 RepID=UPI00248FBB1B|nr:OmpA family protein [Epibacterium ulvae]